MGRVGRGRARGAAGLPTPSPTPSPSRNSPRGPNRTRTRTRTLKRTRERTPNRALNWPQNWPLNRTPFTGLRRARGRLRGGRAGGVQLPELLLPIKYQLRDVAVYFLFITQFVKPKSTFVCLVRCRHKSCMPCHGTPRVRVLECPPLGRPSLEVKFAVKLVLVPWRPPPLGGTRPGTPLLALRREAPRA